MSKKNVWHILIAVSCIVFCITFCLAADNVLTDREKKDGWKLLFDGRTLGGWTIEGEKEGWAVEDGAIACTVKNGGMIYSKEQYGDFILQADFKYEEGANSGIFFRISNLADPVGSGIEMQVLDSYEAKEPGKHDCGAIYDCLEPLSNTVKRAGEWNSTTIICKNNWIWIFLNDKLIIDMDLDKWTKVGQNPDGTPNKFPVAYKDMARRGYIGFQDHGNRVWYRNIKIKPLEQSLMVINHIPLDAK